VIFVSGIAALIYACGGDDTTAITSTDGGEGGGLADGTTSMTDGTTGTGMDANMNADTGGGSIDSGADASDGSVVVCAVDGVACTFNGNQAGICKGGACKTCADLADGGATSAADTSCSTAYAKPSLCIAGVCVSGNCRSDADCKFADSGQDGQICGVATPNLCGKCTKDVQCQNDASFGSTYVCETGTGQCVSGACPLVATTNPQNKCSQNASDLCCGAKGAAGTCQVGTNCCSDADCVGVLVDGGAAANCNNGTCGACAPNPLGPYLVDPSVSDGLASDTGGAGSCAFKTITAALAYIATVKPATATINVEGTATFGAGETFPIDIPKGVTIKGDPAKLPTLAVAAGDVGFTMNATGSDLTNFIVDGQTKTALAGLIAGTGGDATTTIDHVTFKNFSTDGIQVVDSAGKTTGGYISIGKGVTSTGNGANGLNVNGHGTAAITGAAAADAGVDTTAFDANGANGISVGQAGLLTLKGDLNGDPPSTATVSASGNVLAGVVISTALPNATPPPNTITGLSAWNNKTSGLVVFGGSSVTVRASSFLGNAADGVHVITYNDGTTTSDAITGIDLGAGTNADPGKNVLQAPTGMHPNAGAGVCLDISKNLGFKLKAQGNVFSATFDGSLGFVDCVKDTANLTHSTGAGACAAGVDVGVIGPATNSNGVATDNCLQP
jgi:hypothetical protein